jgi:primosomal protein N''
MLRAQASHTHFWIAFLANFLHQAGSEKEGRDAQKDRSNISPMKSEVEMDNWWIKKAYQEQHYERLLQAAAKERLLRTASAKEQQFPIREEVRPMFKRKLIYLTALMIAFSLLVVYAVAAAGGGGGGRYLVM